MNSPSVVRQSTESQSARLRDSLPLLVLILSMMIAATASSVGAQESRMQLRLDPERSDGIKGSNTKGARLAEMLQQSLVLDTGSARGSLPAVFLSVTIRGRRADDVFVSRPFEAQPGLLIESAGGAYPPQVPEDLFMVGEPVSTPATQYPARRLEDYAVREAMQAAQRARSPDGIFMVVVPAEPGARREIAASGLIAPVSGARIN